MNVGLLITARLKSKRLPMKLLKELNGHTVVDRVINRTKSIKGIKEVVLCTSTDPQDFPLVECAKENNILYFKGHPDDVLHRLYEAATFFGFDYFVGVTADNPLFSIKYNALLVEKVQEDPSIDFIYSSGNSIGVNAYIVKTKALKLICEVKDQIDTEIWGRLINRPELFNVLEVPVDQDDLINIARITLDEEEDYSLMTEIFNSFESNHMIDESDIIELLKTRPDLTKINASVRQRDLPENVINGIENFFKEKSEFLKQRKAEIYSQS
jgi:spore coat polysaccharide biosynthesis protein SpsF